jgi:hypothetical protein
VQDDSHAEAKALQIRRREENPKAQTLEVQFYDASSVRLWNERAAWRTAVNESVPARGQGELTALCRRRSAPSADVPGCQPCRNCT